MTSMPTRIEADLFDAAQSVGAVMSRSATQQVNHWVRLGRELESAHGVSLRDIAAVLAGRGSYDLLNALEQAAVRVEWAERMDMAVADLNLEAEFEESGESWVEADSAGRTIVREPGAKRRRATGKGSPAKKTAARKTAAKKTSAKKPAAKKTAAKKPATARGSKLAS